MGLQFYFGGSGAGKSRQLHQDIVKQAGQEPGRNFLFLVPDQFTMQTQIDLVNASSCGGIMNIDVLSFGRLSHRIFEETGYGRKPVLDDTGKSLVLRKVAGALMKDMPVIGKNLNKIGYIHEIKSAISEFKQYDISVTQAGQLAEYAKGRGALYYKLKDLEVIYKGFTDYIAERFITTEESLSLLSQAVHKSEIIKDSVIVFDGFTGFTPIQYRLIQELLTLTNKVIVSITMDLRENPFEIGGEQELFYLSKKTVNQLCKLAKDAGIPRIMDVTISQGKQSRFGNNPELAHLEQNLFRYPMKSHQGTAGISIRKSMNPASEVRQTCIQIKKLVLEEGYCYRDIAVVTGDLETYADYFEREAFTYDIPIFLDRTRGILLNPFIEYIRSALKMVLQNFSYETVFHFLRCGLADFETEEVDRLENYVLAFGIKGKKRWSQAFVRKAKDKKSESGELSERELQEIEKLEHLNQSREKLLLQIQPLTESINTAGEMAGMLYHFIAAGRIQEKLAGYEKYFIEHHEPDRAREYAQIYRLVMELLEQIYSLLEKETMTLQEFADILDAGFGEIEVGTIPGSVDRIVVGDMERSRLKQVKILFFLGVNDGNIPRSSSGGGLISDIDREFLQNSEFELAPSPRQQMYIQRLYLYMNLTKPSERLYLSYCEINSQGESIRPSYLIDLIQKLFPQTEVVSTTGQTDFWEQIVGKKDGTTLLAEELRERAAGRAGLLSEEEFRGLYHLYAHDEEYKKFTSQLTQSAFARYENRPLSATIAKALYGSMLENSVSRLERYAACAYAHFLQYGLQLQEREEYSFEQVDLGNVFHIVLEEFAAKLEDHKLSWFDFSDEEGDLLLQEALTESTTAYGDTILYSSARYEYLTERMLRILKRTIRTLRAQLREGDFIPESYEMSFLAVRDLESVNIALSDEEKMQLHGRIDRIDTYEDENHVYVKVIDYKSGSKTFDLAALYYGLQLQLVVYMNVATEIQQKKHPDKEIIPAALLYYHISDPLIPSERELTPEEVNQQLLKELCTTGIIPANDRAIELLDKNFSKKSLVVPIERKNDGTLTARSSVIAKEDYDIVSQYVTHKIKQFGQEIRSGEIGINPCSQGQIGSCTYCKYSSICEYEAKVPGFKTRILPKPDDETILLKMQEELERID